MMTMHFWMMSLMTLNQYIKNYVIIASLKSVQQWVNWWMEYQVRVFWYQVYQAQLWERMLNRSAGLAMSTCILKALPGKLDIERHSPSIIYLLRLYFTLEGGSAKRIVHAGIQTKMNIDRKYHWECWRYTRIQHVSYDTFYKYSERNKSTDARQVSSNKHNLEYFWRLESIGIMGSHMDSDKDRAFKLFNKTLKFEDERYTKDKSCLPENH